MTAMSMNPGRGWAIPRARSLPCVLHKYHYPKPARPTEDHHIQPKYMHGKNVPSNLAPICPTGHDNVHLYIDWLLANDSTHAANESNRRGEYIFNFAAWAKWARATPEPSVTRSEKALALQGYNAWVAEGRPALLAKETS